MANDKTLECLNVKLETLSSTLKNQSSFNKMLETQLAQIAASVPAVESEKILGQPEAPVENVNMVSTGWGTLLQKRFVGTPRIFFMDGPKFRPFLQMVVGYCSNRPAPKNVICRDGSPPHTPLKIDHF